jgi:hypothetical protein
MRSHVVVIVAAAAAELTASPASGQPVQTPTQQQEARCVAEEQQRDRLALRRFGQRTREAREIRELCRAEVARRFDDRVLGRPSVPGPPPVGFPTPQFPAGNASQFPVGTRLAIGGTWHHVGVDTQADNRFAYFIDTNLIERGPVAEGWLVSVFERTYPNGAASTAFRVRVECATGRWAYRYHGDRDAALRVVRVYPVSNGWKSRVANPNAPIERLRATLCEGASPGDPLPASHSLPADWARAWFAANPR